MENRGKGEGEEQVTEKKAGTEVTGEVICEGGGRREKEREREERRRLIDREVQDVREGAAFTQSLS